MSGLWYGIVACVDEREVEQVERDTYTKPPTPPAHFPKPDEKDRT